MLLSAPDLLIRLVPPDFPITSPQSREELGDLFHAWMQACLAAGLHPQSVLDSLSTKLHNTVQERDSK